GSQTTRLTVMVCCTGSWMQRLTVMVCCTGSWMQRCTVKVYGCWLATMRLTVTFTVSLTHWVDLTMRVTGYCSVTRLAHHTLRVRTSGHGSPHSPLILCRHLAMKPGAHTSSRHSQWPRSTVRHAISVTGVQTVTWRVTT